MSALPNPATSSFAAPLIEELERALTASVHGQDSELLHRAIDAMCSEARQRRVPPEILVLALKSTWRRVRVPKTIPWESVDAVYRGAFDRCLTQYFGETPPA